MNLSIDFNKFWILPSLLTHECNKTTWTSISKDLYPYAIWFNKKYYL